MMCEDWIWSIYVFHIPNLLSPRDHLCLPCYNMFRGCIVSTDTIKSMIGVGDYLVLICIPLSLIPDDVYRYGEDSSLFIFII